MPAKPKKNLIHKDPLVFLLIAAFAFAVFLGLFSSVKTKQEKVLADISTEGGTKIIPVKKEDVDGPEETAKAVYAVDLNSGVSLYSKNSDEPMLPASTTKIATALVVLNHYKLDDILVVGNVAGVKGQLMGLKNGEIISVEDMLYGLLVSSANDAAEAFARNYPGGRESFVVEMNKLASVVGLSKTHFTNPIGFDDYLHFTTAKELTKLAEYAEQNPTFAQMVSTSKIQVSSVDGSITHSLTTTNKLLGQPGILGVKTGTTAGAGESLVTLVERNGHKVMISMLDSQDRFQETEELINWIYSNYEWKAENKN